MNRSNQRMAIKQYKIHSRYKNNCDKRRSKILSFPNKETQGEAKAVLEKEKDLSTTIGKTPFSHMQIYNLPGYNKDSQATFNGKLL